MVSNLTSVFRAKNYSTQEKKDKDKKKKDSGVSSSSEEDKKSSKTMIVPTVTIQEPKPEIEIPKSGPVPVEKVETDYPIASGSVDNVSSYENVPATDVVVLPVLVPLEVPVEVAVVEEPTLGQSLQNIKHLISQKIKELSDKADVWLNGVKETVKKEIEEIEESSKDVPEKLSSFTLYVVCVIVCFLASFVSVSLIRAFFNHSSLPENGWFCYWFAGPFAPLFNAICEEEAVPFIHRIPVEMSLLADEIGHSITNFFDNIAAGFTVFGTLFGAIWSGITNTLSFGCHELGENVGENVAHLLHFFVQVFKLILHSIFSVIATIAGGIAGTASVIQNYFQPQQSYFW